MDEYKCKRCSRSFERFELLSRHSTAVHKTKMSNLYLEYYLNGVHPTCACGCGEKVKWGQEFGRFREFSTVGHAMRVRNNWGHNQKAIEKSSETRRKQFASGERIPWSKGLKKEDSESLQRTAKKCSDRFTPEIRKEYSERMARRRNNKEIISPSRENHHWWNGGVSTIENIARSDVRYKREWRTPILIRDGYKCKSCNSTDNLQVHHHIESFIEIYNKIMENHINEDIENFEIKKTIASEIVDYHIKNKVSGQTLCQVCHIKEHPDLNFIVS